MIVMLIVTGVALLIAIGYLNNVVESNKVTKTRTQHELKDRLRRCLEISETFPGQLMTPALKLLMARLEQNLCQRQLKLDKRNESAKQRLVELEAEIAKGDAIEVSNPPVPIMTEEKAKDVRFLLEALHAQVTRAAQEEFLPAGEARHWIREIRHILVLLHIEFFNNLGQELLSQDQPGQARLAFERGVHYLRNLAEPQVYEEQLKYLEKMLKRTNSIVLTNLEPAADEVNELTEGLKADESESQWKKKVIYD